jgi:vacuolar-type H+-ATPase subunit F/Vma7
MMVDYADSERVSQVSQKYFILLLLTDGIINDMQKTIDEIVRGSGLPLSIIIVGVGNEDFSSMHQLDADDEPLYSKASK